MRTRHNPIHIISIAKYKRQKKMIDLNIKVFSPTVHMFILVFLVCLIALTGYFMDISKHPANGFAATKVNPIEYPFLK